MFRRHLLLTAPAAFVLGACTGGPLGLAMAPNSVLIVTRHADREGDDLTAKGRQRARALVDALDGMPLDAIYAPGIKRNFDTAAPLAAARGFAVHRIPQEAPTAALMQAGAGKSVIWIGNKGNIATIWKDLGLSDPAPLAYGDLHILRSDSDGKLTLDRRRYGPA